jgi:predicted metallopeptidase
MPNAPESPGDELNLSYALTAIMELIVRSSPSLTHIDASRVLVCIGSNRQGRAGGIYGKLVPLKFENGSEVLRHKGTLYGIPEISHNNRSLLYIMYFYMPRFFDLSWPEKVRVMFHELYHISPLFNGDIRRMGKVKIAHGHSKRHYDSLYEKELRSFLDHIRITPHIEFLKMDTKSLFHRYKQVTGVRMKKPRPVTVKAK